MLSRLNLKKIWCILTQYFSLSDYFDPATNSYPNTNAFVGPTVEQEMNGYYSDNNEYYVHNDDEEYYYENNEYNFDYAVYGR